MSILQPPQRVSFKVKEGRFLFMKRIFSLLIAVFTLVSVVGCGSTPSGRELYNIKLSKYVELGKYEGIDVDTSSDRFKEYYDAQISSDVENNDLYVQKTEGKVEDGDIANIDYEGKKDGVAFEGGTSKGYDLEIGSGSFIDGFEDGLIGVNIGDTVDLNLTFPENYGNEELNGAAVVFTVKVNYVKTDEERNPEDYFKELKFKTLRAYTDDVTKRAVKTYLVDEILEDSKVKDYPSDDVDVMYDGQIKMMDSYYQQYYGMTLQSLISAQGQTEEEFKKSMLEESIYPMMEEQMVLYAILDNEKKKVTSDEVENKITEILKDMSGSGVTRDVLVEYYGGKFYFEQIVVSEKVTDILYEKAKIK